MIIGMGRGSVDWQTITDQTEELLSEYLGVGNSGVDYHEFALWALYYY
jgi:hypothetical protein